MTPEDLYRYLYAEKLVGSKGIDTLRQIEPLLFLLAHQAVTPAIAEVSDSPAAIQIDDILTQAGETVSEQLETTILIALIDKHVSPLAALRSIVEKIAKTDEPQHGPETAASTTKVKRRIKRQTDELDFVDNQTERTEPIRAQLSRRVELNSLASLSLLTTHTTHIHINRQEVMSTQVWEQILSAAPQLQSVNIIPSLRTLLTDAKKQLLTSRGIDLTFHRIRNNHYYDSAVSVATDYETEKALFDAVLYDQKKAAELQIMRAGEFPEYIVAAMYYSERHIAVRKIAEALGQRFGMVSNDLLTFKTWMGLPTDNETVLAAVRAMQHRIRAYQTSQTYETFLAEKQATYQVAGVLPPMTLAMEKWDIWQHLQQLFPDGVESAYSRHLITAELIAERELLFMLRYFQIGPYHSVNCTLEMLGTEFGISREWTRLLIKKGLIKIGYFDDEGEEELA